MDSCPDNPGTPALSRLLTLNRSRRPRPYPPALPSFSASPEETTPRFVATRPRGRALRLGRQRAPANTRIDERGERHSPERPPRLSANRGRRDSRGRLLSQCVALVRRPGRKRARLASPSLLVCWDTSIATREGIAQAHEIFFERRRETCSTELLSTCWNGLDKETGASASPRRLLSFSRPGTAATPPLQSRDTRRGGIEAIAPQHGKRVRGVDFPARTRRLREMANVIAEQRAHPECRR
jgi:hypothetical protein